jgi:hypothetical protein
MAAQVNAVERPWRAFEIKDGIEYVMFASEGVDAISVSAAPVKIGGLARRALVESCGVS